MNNINKKRSETMKKRWKEGRFKNRNLKGIPHPWNIGKKGTFKIGHIHSQKTKDKVSKTRIEKGVAKGEKNPFYIHGKSRDPYPTEFKKKRLMILNRNNYTCQLCDTKTIKVRTKNKKWATVHHIDYNKKNNKEENLITLCNICNLNVNTERNKWIEFFKEKLNV